ncbi:MAG TPA: hypothetical protein VKA46_04860 [Gemmataceae bacterium]|nr:hypothetical protein [Gemmataceae bacterium]
MKKLLIASLAALCVSMACQQEASAWSEFKFSAGVNMGWVGGGNRFFWGLYRSAPYPGGPDLPPVIAVGQGPAPAPYGPAPYGAGYGANYGGYAGGYAPGQDYNAAGQGMQQFQAPAPTPAPAPAPMAPVTAGAAPQSYNPYFNTGYQPVGYYQGYSSTQVPSYWYGR